LAAIPVLQNEVNMKTIISILILSVAAFSQDCRLIETVHSGDSLVFDTYRCIENTDSGTVARIREEKWRCRNLRLVQIKYSKIKRHPATEETILDSTVTPP
jgi:hypothetical protein